MGNNSVDNNERVENKNESLNKENTLFARIFAIASIVLIVCLIGWIIWGIVTGSEHLIQIVFTAIIIPMILYFFVWIKKVFSNKHS